MAHYYTGPAADLMQALYEHRATKKQQQQQQQQQQHYANDAQVVYLDDDDDGMDGDRDLKLALALSRQEQQQPRRSMPARSDLLQQMEAEKEWLARLEARRNADDLLSRQVERERIEHQLRQREEQLRVREEHLARHMRTPPAYTHSTAPNAPQREWLSSNRRTLGDPIPLNLSRFVSAHSMPMKTKATTRRATTGDFVCNLCDEQVDHGQAYRRCNNGECECPCAHEACLRDQHGDEAKLPMVPCASCGVRKSLRQGVWTRLTTWRGE